MASNLAEFAAAAAVSEPKHPKCKTCSLPEDVLSQVEDARNQTPPIFYTTIAQWLKSEGRDLTMFNLRNHFQADHHLDAR